MSLRKSTKIYSYRIFYFYSDKKCMVLKTKNILDSSYKIGASIRVKPAEDEDILDAEIIYLHGK